MNAWLQVRSLLLVAAFARLLVLRLFVVFVAWHNDAVFLVLLRLVIGMSLDRSFLLVEVFALMLDVALLAWHDDTILFVLWHLCLRLFFLILLLRLWYGLLLWYVDSIFFAWVDWLVDNFAMVLVTEVVLPEFDHVGPQVVVKHLADIKLILSAVFTPMHFQVVLLLLEARTTEVRYRERVLHSALNILCKEAPF